MSSDATFLIQVDIHEVYVRNIAMIEQLKHSTLTFEIFEALPIDTTYNKRIKGKY